MWLAWSGVQRTPLSPLAAILFWICALLSIGPPLVGGLTTPLGVCKLVVAEGDLNKLRSIQSVF